MIGRKGDWQHHRTERLVLDRVVESDVDQLYQLHGDPAVWNHFPSGRHTSRRQTEEFVQSIVGQWRQSGLGYWSVRESQGGEVVGCGGCRPVDDRHQWNLYYRFRPTAQGKGFAAELARAAVKAADDVDPTRAVVAFMLADNTSSIRVAERVGLARVWVGPDEGNPDPDAVRVVYANRPDIEL